MFLWTRRIVLTAHPENFYQMSPNFAPMPKIFIKLIFLHKKLLISQNVPLDYSKLSAKCNENKKVAQLRRGLKKLISFKISKGDRFAVDVFLSEVFFPTLLRFCKNTESF